MKLIKKKKTFPAFLSSYKKTSENFEKARDTVGTRVSFATASI